MEDKVIANIAIIIENIEDSERTNAVLHEFNEFIIGRMGLPYREKGVCVVSIVMDAPFNVINSLTGKLGMIGSVKAKALYSKK